MAASLPYYRERPVPAWLSFVSGVLVLVAAAYLLYVVLAPEKF
jgi:hypothetical protein